jgi:hypothetical protein
MKISRTGIVGGDLMVFIKRKKGYEILPFNRKVSYPLDFFVRFTKPSA